MRELLLGMMVLVILILAKIQSPVPIPIIHFTKHERLPFLFQCCIQYEMGCCCRKARSACWTILSMYSTVLQTASTNQCTKTSQYIIKLSQS